MHSGSGVSDMLTMSIEEQIAVRGFAVIASKAQGASIEAIEVYTVGLHEQGRPEVVVSGLGLNRSTALASSAAEWLRTNANEPQLCKLDIQLPGEERPVHFVSVPRGVGHWRYEEASKRSEGTARYVRLCVQDDDGKWPWDRDYRLNCSTIERQSSGSNAF